MHTLIQGPGTNSGNSYLNLMERGDEFDMRTWKGTGSSREDWRVQASMADNFMRIGSSTSDAPYMYFKRGARQITARLSDTITRTGGFSSLSLRFSGISSTTAWTLWSTYIDAYCTELNAGSRQSRSGKDYTVLFGGKTPVYGRRCRAWPTEPCPVSVGHRRTQRNNGA